MKTKIALAALFCAALVVATALNAEDKKKEKKFDAKCPVSGEAAKADKTVDYLGKKVYFCCEKCPKAFQADTKKFAAKANHQLFQTGQIALVACPFSGGKLNTATAIDVAGVKVCFCCEKCQAKAKAAEDKVAMIFGDIEKGFTLQNKCPVSGEDIDRDQSVEYEGKKVYFCCEKCVKAFNTEPKKFVDKLPQFKKEEKKS